MSFEGWTHTALTVIPVGKEKANKVAWGGQLQLNIEDVARGRVSRICIMTPSFPKYGVG